MWQLSLPSALREGKRSMTKFKLLITLWHTNATDKEKNHFSASILEHKSWKPSPNYNFPHLLDIWAFDCIFNSVVSTDGSAKRNRRRLESGSDWLVMIEWQMERGHNSVISRRHGYILSGPLLFLPLFLHLLLLPASSSSPPSDSCICLLLSYSSSAAFLWSSFRSDEHEPLLFCKLLISFKWLLVAQTSVSCHIVYVHQFIYKADWFSKMNFLK